MIKNLSTDYSINMEGLCDIINYNSYENVFNIYFISSRMGRPDFDLIQTSNVYNRRNREEVLNKHIKHCEKITILSHIDFIHKLHYGGYEESFKLFNRNMNFNDTFNLVFIAQTIGSLLRRDADLKSFKNGKETFKISNTTTVDILKTLAEKYNANPTEYDYIFNIIKKINK